MSNSKGNIQALQGPILALLTDIDDTLTREGKLPANSYEAIWRLHEKGLPVLAVTGRPAGWCEMIARQWPVDAVIGENGALAFSYRGGRMKRWFSQDEKTRCENRKKLDALSQIILREVPGSAMASDQFTRLFDLAIDFCEDVEPLPTDKVQRIVDLFQKHGATAKVSSIHVNGWFGLYSKYSMSLLVLRALFGWSRETISSNCVYVGDSPNDESLWEHFEKGVCVGDLSLYPPLRFPPKYFTSHRNAKGFVELCKKN
ncbi:MAG: HAD-IIB family hydrolase [Bdellovibrio sp.]